LESTSKELCNASENQSRKETRGEGLMLKKENADGKITDDNQVNWQQQMLTEI